MSNAKIREALEFYARDDVWRDDIRVVDGPNGPEEQRADIPAVDYDMGGLARAALAELDAEPAPSAPSILRAIADDLERENAQVIYPSELRRIAKELE